MPALNDVLRQLKLDRVLFTLAYLRGRAPWDTGVAPPELVAAVEGPQALAPGRALDLGCGTGTTALYLARLGWRVTAVDAAPEGIARLRRAAPDVDARVADLERGEFAIEAGAFDLICDFYYLQRSLFPSIREGVRPGGAFIGAIHLLEPGRNPDFSMVPGELRGEFAGWKIAYYSEGGEPGRRRRSARIIARRA
ncbi:MAG: methyltransferase domain-containing protein [Acidobacteriota bacterium]|nr:methyltransferase domain-containing protein [Acidobacteriota bacterium]